MPRRMGRPPLGLKMVAIRLPKRIGERIDAVLREKENRSHFIREAIEEKVERRERELPKAKPKKSRPKDGS
jgi:metal-responsive CopG/Arc/MetJ family transcriptional regulator